MTDQDWMFAAVLCVVMTVSYLVCLAGGTEYVVGASLAVNVIALALTLRH